MWAIWVKVLLIVIFRIVLGQDNLLEVDNLEKCSPSDSFLETVQWFFNRSHFVIVSDLVINQDVQEFSDYFVQRYPNRPNSPSLIYRNLMKSLKQKFNYRRKTGILVTTESFESLKDFMNNIGKSTLNYYSADFIYLILNSNSTFEVNENKTKEYEDFFRKMWQDHNILTSLLILIDCKNAEITGLFEPFVFNGNISNRRSRSLQSWGRLKWFNFSQLTELEKKEMSEGHVSNFNGFPLSVNQFVRYPTALKQDQTPPVLMTSYVYNVINMTAGDYAGLDGLVLANLEKHLNFSMKNVPVWNEYGWKTDNGTFVGSIGELLNRNIEVSFNGRFVKYYDTFDIDFMYPVFFDRFCIVAPKSLRIPQWLAIFQCFDPTVWSIILLTNILCGCLWFLIKKIFFIMKLQKESTELLKHLPPVKRKEFRIQQDEVQMKFSFIEIVTEMWNIMISGPSNDLPYRGTERIFLTACLLLNLVIAGTFQGSLYTSFSTVSYYKDISTLDVLDKSGLQIVTGSNSILDIFGTEDLSPLMKSLRSKLSINKKNISSIEQAAYNRDRCSVERKADLNVIINTNFVSGDGSPLIHTVEECPRDYYVAYITRKAWPLLYTFNRYLIFFAEAGLINKWYEYTEDGIINRYLLHMKRDDEQLKALTIIDMQTPFMLLGVGVILCFIVFAWELISHRFLKLEK